MSNEKHVECYDKKKYPSSPLDAPIFEIRPGDIDGVSIKVNIFDEGTVTPLSFGENGDLDTIFINVEDPSIIGRVISKRNSKIGTLGTLQKFETSHDGQSRLFFECSLFQNLFHMI